MNLLKNVSFSSLSDWPRCPFSFKLARLDGIYISNSTIDSIFGTIIHSACQNVLVQKNPAKELLKFKRTWTKFTGIYKRHINISVAQKLALAAANIIGNIQLFVEKEFGNDYEILSVEEPLFEPIEGFEQKFKAFLDIVLFSKKLDKIIVIDFKTCSNSFQFKKWAGVEKERQLVLYKFFYSKKYNIPVKKIDTVFILLEKDSNSKSPINKYQITSGSVKTKNHLRFLNKSLNDIISCEVFPKNRLGCRWCPYKESGHCVDPGKERWK